MLLVLFFLAPVVVDIGIAFSDMGRNLRVTQFTTENIERMLSGDRRLLGVLTTTLIYVLCTLAIFNVGYGLILALVTTALPQRTGAFFRAVWLLPRMSPRWSMRCSGPGSWRRPTTDCSTRCSAALGLPAVRYEEPDADAAHRARQRLHRRVVRA